MNHQDILTVLAQNPDAVVQSRDDRKCKTLLAAMGMINDFIRSDSPNFCVLSSGGHPTHWVVGACWSGYAEPGGNGYAVYCFPKSQVPEEGLHELREDIAKANGGYDLQQRMWLRPDDWQKLN